MLVKGAPGVCGFDFKSVIFKCSVLITFMSISSGIAFRWMAQATSHCLNKCWLRSMTPYGVTRPRWVQQKCLRYQSHSNYRTHPKVLPKSLQWRHNDHDGVSNHQPHDCLLNRLFRRRSKKTSKLRVTGLCAGNSPVTGEFPAQRASNTENLSIWWCHHGQRFYWYYNMWNMFNQDAIQRNGTHLWSVKCWH